MSNPFEDISSQLSEIRHILNNMQAKPNDTVEIISRPELLKRLEITEPTLIRWAKKGKIPEMRFGANIRYNWPAVVASLESAGK